MQLGCGCRLMRDPHVGVGGLANNFNATIGFAFPRLLIAMGVPLEEWIRLAGELLGMAAEDINTDAILWAISIVLFVVLTGIEAWRQPVERVWRKIRRRASFSEQVAADLQGIYDRGVELRGKLLISEDTVDWIDEVSFTSCGIYMFKTMRGRPGANFPTEFDALKNFAYCWSLPQKNRDYDGQQISQTFAPHLEVTGAKGIPVVEPFNLDSTPKFAARQIFSRSGE